MEDSSKLSFLKGLSSEIDWNLDTIKKTKDAPGADSKGFNSPARKLTKSQKKTAKRNLAFALAQECISKKQVETLVFDNPDATWKKDEATLGRRTRSGQLGKGAGGIDIDLKKTRFEIMKFGMTGMSVTEKADAETALAISLGAQPDKNSFVNYKDLQNSRKKEREEKVAKEEAMIKPKIKSTRKTKSNKKGKASNKLSSNNVIVKPARGGNNNKSGGNAKESAPKRVFSGKRPDKRNREAARKNR